MEDAALYAASFLRRFQGVVRESVLPHITRSMGLMGWLGIVTVVLVIAALVKYVLFK
jgi:hypothetical protein